MTLNENNWLAPVDCKVPDFIICGAMKCGTTTLHAILNQHPDVFIPSKEVNFFDLDDVFQHPDFNLYLDQKWMYQDLESDPKKYWYWYSTRFEGAEARQTIGEDSTTYIASEKALQRISQQNKKIKLIVMLRNPVSRAYSHYWHLLRTGRATHTFEETLQYNPYSILNRSMYVQQIETLYKYLPKEQVKVIVFEDFISDVKTEMKDICSFLEIDHTRLTKSALELHENIARTPKFPGLQILKNRYIPSLGYQQYQNHFDSSPIVKSKKISIVNIIEFLHRQLNPLLARKPPVMKKETKDYLENLFKKELKDLDNILEKRILFKWFKNNSF